MKISFLKSESTNKAIFSSMSFSMAAKVFTFAQSLVVSFAFGTQKSTDILFFSLSIIVLLTTFFSTIDQQVIVPTVISIRNNASEEDSKKFISYIYFIYAGIGIMMTLILLLSPEGLFAAFSKFSEADIIENSSIVRFIIPVFFFSATNSFLLDMFTSYRFFTMPMMLDVVKNVMIIAFVFLFRGVFSVKSLAMGVFFGSVTQFVILNFLLFKGLKFRLTFKRYRIDEKVRKNIAYVVIGQLTTFLNGFIIMYLISGFSAGIYSSMDYGQKINTVFSAVVVGQLSTVIGINFIEFYSKKNFSKLNEIFGKYLKMGLFLLFPFCFIVSLNADTIISLIFERGRFNSQSVAMTSGFLRYFILTIPYVLVNSFMVRLIIAKQIQRIAFMWQISQNIGNIIVVWIMVKLFGHYGYPMGVILSSTVYIILLMHFLLKKEFKFINSLPIIKFFIGNFALNAVIAVFMHAVLLWTGKAYSPLGKIMYLLVVSVVYVSIYFGFSMAIKQNREILLRLAAYFKVFIGRKLSA